MVGNYIKLGLRQLRHQNVHSMVSLLGITLSITSSILLFLYLRNEFSYDRFDSDIPVYRIASDAYINDNQIQTPTAPSGVGPSLPYSFVRIETMPEAILQVGDMLIHEEQVYAVDHSFFDIFPQELLSSQKGPLLAENTIVLTESLAEKLFGNTNPIGKKVKVNRHAKVVSGVIRDPFRTHLNYSGLVLAPDRSPGWTSFSTYTYIKTSASVEEISEKLQEVYDDKMAPFFVPNNSRCSFFLQPVASIHLESNLRGELEANGSKTINFALVMIGIFMILVAGINYINLATARAIRRAKEIAIRKAVGSYRSELIYQFVVESVLLVFFGVFLSLIAIDIIFPYLDFVSYTQVYDISIVDWQLLLFISFVVLTIGLMGSVFPAIEMARFNVTEILNGTFSQPGVKISRRRFLLFVQFCISIILVVCTLVIRKQISYVQDLDLGYVPDQLMSVALPHFKEGSKPTFLNNLRDLDFVDYACTSETVPGEAPESLTSFYFKEEQGDNQILAKYFHADENFVESLTIRFIEGHNFDSTGQVLINQTLANQLHQPLGTEVRVPIPTPGPRMKQVVGIISDIHLQSLHQEIQPLIILYRPNNAFALVKLNEIHAEHISSMQQIFQKSFPDFPFDYQFVEDRVEKMYARDIVTARLFGVFALITSCLAIMGMFALSFYTSEIRKQEIGIRKINGATITEILLLINKEYLLIVLLSALVSMPVAYLFLENWLQDFTYKIPLNGWNFMLVLLVTFVVSMITVSINTYKAAQKDITLSLKR